jgi:small subunit ribosomal protein S16
MGKKKQPFYRIVAIDSRASRDGRYIDSVGYYNPVKQPAELKVSEERALYWLGQGAIPSDTVRSFLKKEGILLKWHLLRQGADEAKIEGEIQKWQTQQSEKEKRVEALEEQKLRQEAAEKEAEAKKAEAEAAASAAKKAKAEAAEAASAASEEVVAEVETAEPQAAVEPVTDTDEGASAAETESPEEPAEEKEDK